MSGNVRVVKIIRGIGLLDLGQMKILIGRALIGIGHFLIFSLSNKRGAIWIRFLFNAIGVTLCFWMFSSLINMRICTDYAICVCLFLVCFFIQSASWLWCAYRGLIK